MLMLIYVIHMLTSATAQEFLAIKCTLSTVLIKFRVDIWTWSLNASNWWNEWMPRQKITNSYTISCCAICYRSDLGFIQSRNAISLPLWLYSVIIHMCLCVRFKNVRQNLYNHSWGKGWGPVLLSLLCPGILDLIIAHTHTYVEWMATKQNRILIIIITIWRRRKHKAHSCHHHRRRDKY